MTALPDYFGVKEQEKDENDKATTDYLDSVTSAVQQRRISAEMQKKEKANLLRLEKER